MITTQSRSPDLTITGMVISSGKAPACKTHSSQINRTQCENRIYSMSLCALMCFCEHQRAHFCGPTVMCVLAGRPKEIFGKEGEV